MFARRLPSRCRLKRHARRIGLRGLRVVRRHYFSLASAAILGAALALTLSHSGIEPTRAAAPSTESTAGTPTRPATPAGQATAAAPSPTPVPPSRLLVYYVVASEEEKDILELAIRSHALDQAHRGTLNLEPPTFRYFLIVRDPHEEAQAIMYLDDLAVLAQTEGYRLLVVDAR